MPLHYNSYRNKIIAAYCIIFYVLMVYKWFNGMFLYQMDPYFFYTRKDVFTWLFMATRIHTFLLNNKAGLLVSDIFFYAAPLLFYFINRNFNKFAKPAAMVLLLINWLYVQCYTLYPTNSIEAHIGWLLFPVVFVPRNIKTAALLFDGLRYFFLFFFASAGIWKFVQGGIFNTHQMSNILLMQHKELLVATPEQWYAVFIRWLINHTSISYALYLMATILELCFIIGFFTKKHDKLLLFAFMLFLLFDHFFMRIPYYDIAPLALTLLFNRYRRYRS